MISRDVKRLLLTLNDATTRALEGAAGLAVGRGHYEVTVEHLLLKLLEDGTGDATLVLTRLGADVGHVGRALTAAVERMRTGNAGRPAFSPLLLDVVERAWIAASLHHGLAEVRSGALVEAFLEADQFAMSPVRDAMAPATADAVRERFGALVEGSDENRAARHTARLPSATGGETALDLYTHSVTDQARDGKIDAVFGRDREIRQVIDVLSRRRKNNPILVGEAGVGKTAVVEGLALRIALGDVPEALREAEIAALDLGALQAGAGVKGEFEARMKAVIDAVRDAPRPTILFIDEAHTLVGAGGGEGAMDAANILKPALARGELRAIGATTLDEYQKFFEKDKALERRFQMVLVKEPSVDDTVAILRGIKDRYEVHHGVRITDGAIVAAAELSDRYVTNRFLPDKAIDLIDEAAARLRIQIDSKPDVLDAVERQVRQQEIAREAVRREGDTAQADAITQTLADLGEERDRLAARWEQERGLVQTIKESRAQIDALRTEAEALEREGDFGRVAEIRYGQIPALDAAVETASASLRDVQQSGAMLKEEVDAEDIADVVSRATGIPVARMLETEKEKLLGMEAVLAARVVGQPEAVAAVANAVRRSRAGLQERHRPLGSFIFLGTTGVGKTELAKALAEQLFDDENALVRIDMSEYQERHTVSRLVGAPPGYVGYDEGGQLTEAVRRRPYAVVLLDEFEKAHPEVSNILLQVLDDGRLTDSKGRVVDFSNTLVIMTSNIGSDVIAQRLAAGPVSDADMERLSEELTALLRQRLRPEFLNRIDDVIVFHPLEKKDIFQIIDVMKADLFKRVAELGIGIEISETAKEFLVDKGFDPAFGARPLRRAIQRYVEDPMAEAILTNDLGEGAKISVDRKEGADELTFKTRKARKKKDAETPDVETPDGPDAEAETPAEDAE